MISTHAMAVVAGIAIGAYSGWTARSWKADADELAAHQAAEAIEAEQRTRIMDAAAELERLRAAAKTEQRVIVQEVDRVVTRYRDRPCLDDDGLRVVRRAIEAANTGVAAATVPAASAAR